MTGECTDGRILPGLIPGRHIGELPTTVYHRFRLRDANMVTAWRQYECPKKYRETWEELLNQHLAAGRLRESSSPYASPAFLIPKAVQMAADQWLQSWFLISYVFVCIDLESVSARHCSIWDPSSSNPTRSRASSTCVNQS